jgi:phage FluMu gp28-like protein
VTLGIDFGRSNDPTACWALERIGDVEHTREVLVERGMSTPDQARMLEKRCARASRVAVDYTGPGIGLGDCLAEKFGQWKPEAHKFGKIELCTFTADFKRKIFPRLRAAFEAPTKVRIPISTAVREDLHAMKQIVRNGEYSYAAPRTGEGHSDRCTALALAKHAASDPQPGGCYAIVI